MNINFKIVVKVILAILFPVIVFGEINPFLLNAGSTILYYLGVIINFISIYLEYLLIKNISKEMVKNEKE